MLSKISFRWLPASIVLLGLAGCAEFDQRKGLDPVIDGAAVQTASYRKSIIINALAEDAGFRAGEPVDYYKVTEAGFNYVDDQCRAYFDSLFFLDRHRDELKSGLAAAAATTATILGITHGSVPSLTIVAAAFGLASSATDIVAGTYLYGRPPATTQGFVERLQLAYRSGAAANRGLINSPTIAYYHIQRYLNLCLPPTIEAEITRQVSSSSAIFVPTGAGAFFDVHSVGAPASALPRVRFIGPSPISREEVGRARIGGVIEPTQGGKHIPRQDVERAFVRQVQAALCVSPTDGAVGDSTRSAIQMYLQAKNQKPPDPIDPLDPVLRTRLQKAVDDVGNCSREGFRNAYEVGLFGVPSELKASRIKDLQKKIGIVLRKKGSGITILQTKMFDQQTRDGISELRRLMNGTNGDQIDPDLENAIID